MYYLRPQGDDVSLVDDASDFESISKTMVLSTLMLTGQGGPSGKLPWYTQLVVLLTGIFSVAMFAIPASMLTWGFEDIFRILFQPSPQLDREIYNKLVQLDHFSEYQSLLSLKW